jgi:hypothetical protein
MVAAQPQRRPEPLVGVRRRHPDVNDSDVGPPLRHRGQQRRTVTDRGANLMAAVFEQPDQPRPEQCGVFSDHDPERHWRPLRPGAAVRR